MQDQMIRWPAVKAITGLSRSTVWRLERESEFPKRRQIGSSSVGWLSSEVTRWIETRPVAHKLK